MNQPPIDASKHLGLVGRMLRRMRPHDRNVEESEEWADAVEGLVRAANTFEPSLGLEFSTYAFTCMHAAVADGIKSRGRKMRTACLRQLNDADADGLSDRFDLLDEINRAEESARIHAAVRSLPARERQIVKLRFFDGLTLEQAGRRFGLSPKRIDQIQKRALLLLRLELTTKEKQC